MNTQTDNARASNRGSLLLGAIGVLAGAMAVHSAGAADAATSAPAPSSALTPSSTLTPATGTLTTAPGLRTPTPATQPPTTTQPSPAAQPRKSQPLNWGALNPQPLPPGPPDPTRPVVNPANLVGQHGIIIIGGKPTIGSSPGTGLNPSVGAPVAAPLNPATALGTQAQPSQRPTTPQPANMTSNRPNVSGTGQSQALPGANGNGKRLTLVASSRKLKVSPQRTSLLQQEAAALAADNATARSIRLHATATAAPVVARPTSLTPGIATGGVFAQVATAQGPARMKAVGQNALHIPPGIWFVNNKESGFTVTPGGYLTIQGKGFGDTVGEVNLFGHDTPQRFPFQIIEWHDDEVYALLPLGISGVPDQLARLQVVTRSGTTYLIDNAKFHATRAEITLTTNLDRLVEMHSASNWPANPAMSTDGQVVRDTVGTTGDIDCNAPGADDLYFKPPTGWDVSGMQAWFGRTDTSADTDAGGRAGDRIFTPGYDLGDFTRASLAVSLQHSIEVWMIPVKWGVWRTHSSTTKYPGGFVSGFGSPDECLSNYQIAVQLIGPAGVSPY